MNESTLRTGFVCIATEGKAVDGRDITREWLVDMAETYDPTYYTAVIWPEHDRWSSYGTVQALKTEEVDGKIKLFAVLCPNRDLVYWNQNGQYQFCSIEPFEQFADLGYNGELRRWFTGYVYDVSPPVMVPASCCAASWPVCWGVRFRSAFSTPPCAVYWPG